MEETIYSLSPVSDRSPVLQVCLRKVQGDAYDVNGMVFTSVRRRRI